MVRESSEVCDDIVREKKKVAFVKSTRDLVSILNNIVDLIKELDEINHRLAAAQAASLITTVEELLGISSSVKVTEIYSVWCKHKETLEVIKGE